MYYCTIKIISLKDVHRGDMVNFSNGIRLFI